MKIRTAAVLGAGAIGAYFIDGLADRLGENLWVIAEGERAERLKAEGITVNDRRIPLHVKTPEEARPKKYLDGTASEALREKIAALPDRFNLDAAWRFIQDEARKQLKNRSGFLEHQVVFRCIEH